MTMHVDLGAGDRKGKMWIALPDTRAAPDERNGHGSTGYP